MIDVNGTRLHYVEKGTGPDTIVFSHGLLWSHHIFSAQIDALSQHFRCIAYDHRGQGDSDVPPEKTITIETCTDDCIELIGLLDAAPCHFVGLSMGGFVGMRIAARRPELIRTLALFETAADPEPKASARKYKPMSWAARVLGVNRLLAARVMPIMFGETFLNDPERVDERREWRDRLMHNKRTIYRSVNGVVERRGIEHELRHITAPTLVLHGDEDKAISRSRALSLVEHIPDSRFVTLRAAGHTATVEQPGASTAALAEFYGL